MPPYVIDTTLFSNFAHAQRADILKAVVGVNAITTQNALAELRAGEESGYLFKCDYGWVDVATLTPGEAERAEEFRRVVHLTEAECLALALERQGVFLSDDFAARRLAVGHGVAVSGTIGVLRMAVEKNIVQPSEADKVLRQMIMRGYRSPIQSLRELPD